MAKIPHDILHIDGTLDDGSYASNDGKAPYCVFNESTQENVAGPYSSKRLAIKARAMLRSGKIPPAANIEHAER